MSVAAAGHFRPSRHSSLEETMPADSVAPLRFPGRFLGGCALVASLGAVATSAIDERAASAGERAMKVPLASRSLLLDVAARDRRLVAVGDRGHILVSLDGGGSWTQADVPTRALLTGVFMHDGQLGWAVGHDHVALRTRDGGLTWERVNYAPEKEKPLLDVWFADARRGLAVGAYGELLTTSNGGTTWGPRRINGGDDFHLNQIVAAGDGTLYVAAEAGRLYRSDDGGTTWQVLPSPYQGSFFGVLPLSDGPLLAFGLRGNLYRSPDGGRTWARIETSTEATLTTALQLGPQRFVVAGMAGTLLWSDGGSGAVRKQELPGRRAIAAMARGDDRNLLLFGEGGVQRVDIPR
jgi:photosystem II stability/assembly factor-like uncharacterized protein